MARKVTEKARPAELQKFSRALNKTRIAAIMGIVGLLFLAVARFFLTPEWVKTALVVFLVGVASSLLSVGGTYLGNCPYCGAKTDGLCNSSDSASMRARGGRSAKTP